MYAFERYGNFDHIACVVDCRFRIPHGIPACIFVVPRPHQITLYPVRINNKFEGTLIVFIRIDGNKNKIVAENIIPVRDVRTDRGWRTVGANKTEIDEPGIV